MESLFRRTIDAYGSWMWHCAKRYHTGCMDAEDVFNSLLVAVHGAASEDGNLDLADERRVKSFIITKAIDMVRTEVYRSAAHDLGGIDPIDFKPWWPGTQMAQIEALQKALSLLTPTAKRIFIEALNPSEATYELARSRQEASRSERERGVGLKMNVLGDPKIHMRDVGEALGLSPATTSRHVTEIREVLPPGLLRELADLFGW